MLKHKITAPSIAAVADEIFDNTKAISWIVGDHRQKLFEELEKDEYFGMLIGYKFTTLIPEDYRPTSQALVHFSEKIARNCQTKSDESRLVLFSGDEMARAEEFVAQNPHYQVVHSMPAGAMLEMMNLFGLKVGHITRDEQYTPWNILATRLVDEASGDVTAFLNKPKATSTFISKEMPQIMSNPSITSVNSVEKHRFKEFLDNSLDIIASPVFGIKKLNSPSPKI